MCERIAAVLCTEAARLFCLHLVQCDESHNFCWLIHHCEAMIDDESESARLKARTLKIMTESTLNSPRVAVTTRKVRAGNPHDVELVHGVYQYAPEYFEQISMPVPTIAEVETDIAVAQDDTRRTLELVLVDWHTDVAPIDPVTSLHVAGYLDYKLDYPNAGDATVNLLLIRSDMQSHGIGRSCARELETRLAGQARRLLASIYGSNPRARKFWQRLGYHFAIDARPMVEWYGKELLHGEPVGA